MSAVAALAALFVAWMSLKESRRAQATAQRERAHAMDSTLQARLDPMYPGLRRVLGHLDDGVPRDIRHILIPFFVLFSDAFAAHRNGLLGEDDWNGFGKELAYWAQKPTSRRAWAVFRQQTWTAGFVEHVDAVLTGPPAYPDLRELEGDPPEIDWPEETSSRPGVG
jgi:hypothetical protein